MSHKINVLKVFRNLKTYRAKCLKKKISERVIFGKAAGYPPANFLKNEYIRRSFQDFTFFKKNLFQGTHLNGCFRETYTRFTFILV